MGIFKDAYAEGQQRTAAVQEMAAATRGLCPDVKGHYVTEVNKGSIRMGTWQSKLNEMYAKGYRLDHVLEQDGNTIQVFAHAHE